MSKVFIDGHVFDTDKARWTASLDYVDANSNLHTGRAYRSSTGIFYVYTPSQWGNMHSWIIMSPKEILDAYGEYLSEDEADYVIAAGKIQVE